MLTKVANTATQLVVANSPNRLGKSLYWCPIDDPVRPWLEGEDYSQGVWIKPDDIGLEKTSRVTEKYIWRIVDTPTFTDRERIRAHCASTSNYALIMGIIRPEIVDTFAWDEESKHLYSELGAHKRSNNSVFIDAPRSWFTIDIDDLCLTKFRDDVDLVRDDAKLAHYLFEAFEACKLSWLVRDCIIHLSASHGLVSRTKPRVHVEWLLDEPMTIAQQKNLATYINKVADDAGYGEICDTRIYDANRLLFANEAQGVRRVWTPGKKIELKPTPVPKMQRVRTALTGDRYLEVPDVAGSYVPAAVTLAKIAKLTGAKGAKISSLSEVTAGNVHRPVLSHIFKSAMRCRSVNVDAAFSRACDEVVNAILFIPGQTPEEAQTRINKHANPKALRRSWDGAYQKRTARRGAVKERESKPRRPEQSVTGARGALRFIAEQCIKDALEYAEYRKSEPMLPKPPTHTLVRVPPGLGKTQSVSDAAKQQLISTNRISILTPTTSLSEEVAQRKASTLPQDKYHQSLVRHYKGRAQLCTEQQRGVYAERVEAVGLSPSRMVCRSCPANSSCEYIAQQSDNTSGLKVGQHAHATSTFNKMSSNSALEPDFIVIDESILGTLLNDKKTARTFAQLTQDAGSAVIRSKGRKRIRMEETSDAVALRTSVLNMLKYHKHRLPTQALRHLLPKPDERYASLICDMLKVEDDIYWSASAILEEHFDTLNELITKDQPTGEVDALIETQVERLKASQFWRSLYKAIEASLLVPGRAHVFGVHISESNVIVQIRQDLPRAFAERNVLWLDGTAIPQVWLDTVKHINVNTHVSGNLDVEPGPYTLIQYTDRPYSKAHFLGAANQSQKLLRADANVQAMRRYILSLSLKHSQVLVMTTLDIKRALFRVMGGTPVLTPTGSIDTKATRWVIGNVHFEHFNALRGLDKYRNVPCAVVIGRPMPPPDALALRAEAFYYDNPDVPTLDTTAPLITRTRTLSLHPNHEVTVQAECYADDRLENLRQQMTDAEVQQALHRLRLFDRTNRNPAEIHMFGQTNTGLVVSELRDWADVDSLSELEIILERGVYSPAYDVATKLAGGILATYPRKHFENKVKLTSPLDGWTKWLARIDGISHVVWTAPWVEDAKTKIEVETGMEIKFLKETS